MPELATKWLSCVCRWPHNAEARLQSRARSRTICSGYSGRGFPPVWQDYLPKVPVILHDNLQCHLTNLTVFLPQSQDGSCYVSRTILAPPPLWLQKRTDLCARDFGHSPAFWHQPRLVDLTCAWSWRLCGINPGILLSSSVINSPPVLHTSLSCTVDAYNLSIWTSFITALSLWHHH
jgi:hypothetical protein